MMVKDDSSVLFTVYVLRSKRFSGAPTFGRVLVLKSNAHKYDPGRMSNEIQKSR